MRTTILWSQRARRDLLEIGDFIAHDKPGAAARLVSRITDMIERVVHFPAAGRVVPEVGRDDIREVILDKYRIVYRLRDNEITVLTVFRSHRLFVEPDFDDQAAE